MSRVPEQCQILIIGSGNAGFAAALSAAESGGKDILIIDKCPEDWVGGNSFFTAGAFRTVHSGSSDIVPIVNNLDEETAAKVDLPPYTAEDFTNDLKRVTDDKYDKQLGKVLVEESLDTIRWLKKLGIRFQLSFNRQAYQVDGRWKFWGGLALKTQDGGAGLIQDYLDAARKYGVRMSFDTAAKEMVTNPDTGAVCGVAVERQGHASIIKCEAVILAAGGFEANPDMRKKHLGSSWTEARVRGTPFNTGDLLEIAVRDVKAKKMGDWAGCHSVAWDANAPPDSGDRRISNEYTKSGYPLGLMVNVNGERFVDEGADLRNYTYAKFGRAILQQPGGVAFQVWDAKTVPLLRQEEYRDSIVEKITGKSIQELAENCKIHGLQSSAAFVRTIEEYNNAVRSRREITSDSMFDPSRKDGLRTYCLPLPKSNWALALDEAPFTAVKVACGITFTFGGLGINSENAGVLGEDGEPITGLYCAGEMMGGLFWENYPGGSGLTSGAVFGKKAGAAAAQSLP